MHKIKISKISEDVYSHKGFDKNGCVGCQCTDQCCLHGADVDKEAYDLIKHYREQIERMTTIAFEDLFEDTWSGETDFLGGNSIRSRVGETGYCIFHFTEHKGCILFKLAFHDGLPKRIIPSICRLFPLTWNNGSLEYYRKEAIPFTCNCLEPANRTTKSVFQTQKEAIADIFEISS
jgi:hypothetical protein